jgi:hypothetical protein
MQKELTEAQGEQGKEKNDQKPEGRRDPNDPQSAEKDDPKRTAEEAARQNVPAWFASLPAQVRDALDRGDFESVPAAYRELVQRYVLWLQKEARRKAAGD